MCRLPTCSPFLLMIVKLFYVKDNEHKSPFSMIFSIQYFIILRISMAEICVRQVCQVPMLIKVYGVYSCHYILLIALVKVIIVKIHENVCPFNMLFSIQYCITVSILMVKTQIRQICQALRYNKVCDGNVMDLDLDLYNGPYRSKDLGVRFPRVFDTITESNIGTIRFTYGIVH